MLGLPETPGLPRFGSNLTYIHIHNMQIVKQIRKRSNVGFRYCTDVLLNACYRNASQPPPQYPFFFPLSSGTAISPACFPHCIKPPPKFLASIPPNHISLPFSSTPPGIWRKVGVVGARMQRTPCGKALWTAFLPTLSSTPPGICRIMGVVAVRIPRTPCEKALWSTFPPILSSTPPGICRIMGVVAVRIPRTPYEKAFWTAFLPTLSSTPPGICRIMGVVGARDGRCGGTCAARPLQKASRRTLRCTKKVGHKREKDERDQELPCTFFGTDP